MRRIVILVVCGLFAFMAAVGTAQAAAVVWVDDDFNAGTAGWGTTHFDVIQDGINIVDVGGTVNVADGAYGADAVTGKCANITKSLSLIGESRAGTIIDGSIGGVGSSGSFWPKGIHVAANDVTIKNFTATGFTGDLASTGGYGVLFRDYAHDTSGEGFITYSNNTVENVKVANNYSAVYALVNEYLTVKDCLVEDNLSDGMFIARLSHHATIEGNTVRNSGDQGIWFGNCWAGQGESDYGLIQNNLVDGAREAGINVCDSDHTRVAGNRIINADGEGWAIGALSIISGSSDVEVFRNAIYGNDCAGIGIGTPGSASTLSDIIIGGSAVNWNDVYGNAGGGIWFNNATATTGIEITYNNLYGNAGDDFDALTNSTVTADARWNWWGADIDPLLAGYLVYDDPGDTILYSPWATTAHVPEPISMIFFGTGMVGVFGFVARRKMRSRD